MKIVGVILARYQSSRFPGKPLVDLCGKPMVWWVYQQSMKVELFDQVLVATDDDRIMSVCKDNQMNCIMTSSQHNTPTSRLYEVSTKINADIYVFLGGDEPLIEPEAIRDVIKASLTEDFFATNAMTTIQTAPEVIDFTNIKIVVNSENYLLYTTRSPLPYPRGGLDFVYKKFVGIGAFSKEALDFYEHTPKSSLEIIEECDLLRFIERFKPVKMVDVECKNISVDTPKDLDMVRNLMMSKIKSGEL